MKKRTRSLLLSFFLCLALLVSCGTSSDISPSSSNRNLISQITQQEVQTELSPSDSRETEEMVPGPETQENNTASDLGTECTRGASIFHIDAPTFSLCEVPAFSDIPYVAIHENVPYFTKSELTGQFFEAYSDLDALGRCGTAFASVGRDLMPTEPRGSIGMVKPSGWHTVRYDDLVDGKYLYNRCHLIGYQLTGENANTKNLITGTRYLNMSGMLPFENMVTDYVKETGNHVMYRVTPIFEGDNLVATGVLMEGYSVEDNGAGICYCVFVYNAQPGIEIDYATGDSKRSENTEAVPSSPIVTPIPSPTDIPTVSETPSAESEPSQAVYILNTNTKKFHYPSCSSVQDMKEKNKQEFHGTRAEAIEQGYSPCGRCKP